MDRTELVLKLVLKLVVAEGFALLQLRRNMLQTTGVLGGGFY